MDLVDAQPSSSCLGQLGRLFDFANFVEKGQEGLISRACAVCALKLIIDRENESIPLAWKNTGQLMNCLRGTKSKFQESIQIHEWQKDEVTTNEEVKKSLVPSNE